MFAGFLGYRLGPEIGNRDVADVRFRRASAWCLVRFEVAKSRLRVIRRMLPRPERGEVKATTTATCRCPITIYQTFIAGSADKKMFRVLRERWLQVVMGQKFEFDEATSEEVAARVALPAELASELTFDLGRWGVPD